jgi:hypothetical protein
MISFNTIVEELHPMGSSTVISPSLLLQLGCISEVSETLGEIDH